MKLVILFAAAPAAHWSPRFAAAGVNVEVAEKLPTVSADGSDVIGLPPCVDGVVYLVNARIAGLMTGQRADLRALPPGAPQNDSPVGLDYLIVV